VPKSLADRTARRSTPMAWGGGVLSSGAGT
jgi:hypothetical protein